MQSPKTWPLFVLFVLLVSQQVSAQGLQSLETEDLRLLYFDPSTTYLAPHVARSFENTMVSQRSIFGYEPDGKITSLLVDFADYGNASAGAVPRNTLMLDISPLSSSFETLTANVRFYLLMNHELTHIVSTDMATSADKRLRRFFGGKVMPEAEHPETILYSALTSPRILTPGWYMEGNAVFLETWLAGGVGRAQGAYNEMVFRSMVRDEAHFYDPLGLVSEGAKIDFQVGVNNYLYGTRFVSYVAHRWSPEKLVEWIARNEGSRRSYRAQFEQVFGTSLEQAWQEWIDWEHEFQRANLETVTEYPLTEMKSLSDRALGSVSRAYYDAKSDRLYLGLRYPGVVANVGALSLEDGSLERLEDIKGPMLFRVTSLAFDEDARTLFYTTDNTAFRDLIAIDIETGESELLLKDARIGELVFNRVDRSLWGIRHLNGIATLVRIPHPYTSWNQVMSFDYGIVPSDLDISHDGSLLSATFSDLAGNQTLRVMESARLLEGDAEPRQSFDFGLAVPEGFVFSPDDKYLFGSSYYTGVSNIFRYELETGDIEAVSNVETGLFRPIPMQDGSLIAFRFSGDGFTPVQFNPVPLEDLGTIRLFGNEVIRKHPQLQEWQVGSAKDIPLDEMTTHSGPYVPRENLEFESMYPILEGYKDTVALGLSALFSDPIMLDRLRVSASYSLDQDLPSSERTHLSIDYRHTMVSASPLAGSWNLGAALNGADFYDLAGPTERSRKGNRFTVGYKKTLVDDGPRRFSFETDISHYSGFDALPRYQNVSTLLDKLTTINADLEYSNQRRSLGAVDYEKGFSWGIGTSVDHVDGDNIPKLLGKFDFGFALPWKHSSIWLRNSAGAAFGEQADEFANFFFGGFGNNYVDRGSIKRYREYYAMPGFELNRVPGRNFHRAMLEWNLPPIRFKRVGTPSFYLTWARPSLFVSSLTTNIDDSLIRDEVTNAGLQVDFRFTILSRLSMTLSLGYAEGFGNDSILDDDEFMVSLKIL
ncbi:MAG: hypothetical protein WBN44_04065 [Woeseiaceae bacterium]